MRGYLVASAIAVLMCAASGCTESSRTADLTVVHTQQAVAAAPAPCPQDAPMVGEHCAGVDQVDQAGAELQNSGTTP